MNSSAIRRYGCENLLACRFRRTERDVIEDVPAEQQRFL